MMDSMTKGERHMAKIHLECGRIISHRDKLEQALYNATNFISHMHNSRLETEGKGTLTKIGFDWVKEWQELIQNKDLKKTLISPNDK